jgi:hypothetical protein
MENELVQIFEKIRVFIKMDIPLDINENEKIMNEKNLSESLN